MPTTFLPMPCLGSNISPTYIYGLASTPLAAIDDKVRTLTILTLPLIMSSFAAGVLRSTIDERFVKLTKIELPIRYEIISTDDETCQLRFSIMSPSDLSITEFTKIVQEQFLKTSDLALFDTVYIGHSIDHMESFFTAEWTGSLN